MDTIEIEQELALQRGQEPGRPPDGSEDSEAAMVARVAAIAALPEAEVAARDAELDARQREIRDLIDAELQRRSSDEASVQAPEPEPEPPAPPSAEPVQAAREPFPRPVGQGFLRVLSDLERSDPLEHDHPSWTHIT